MKSRYHGPLGTSSIISPSHDYRSRLIASRERFGLTRREMAKRLLTPRATYEQWEKGQRRTPGVAVAAAELLAPPTIRTATRDNVLELADGTRTAAEIAAELEMHVGTVRQALKWLKRRGQKVAVSRRSGRASPRRDKHVYDGIANLANGTRTVADIAAVLGRTKKQIRNAIMSLRRSGKNVELADGYARYTSASIERAVTLVRDGKTVATAVREVLGNDNPNFHATVSRACDAAGVARRRHPAYSGKSS